MKASFLVLLAVLFAVAQAVPNKQFLERTHDSPCSDDKIQCVYSCCTPAQVCCRWTNPFNAELIGLCLRPDEPCRSFP